MSLNGEVDYRLSKICRQIIHEKKKGILAAWKACSTMEWLGCASEWTRGEGKHRSFTLIIMCITLSWVKLLSVSLHLYIFYTLMSHSFSSLWWVTLSPVFIFCCCCCWRYLVQEQTRILVATFLRRYVWFTLFLIKNWYVWSSGLLSLSLSLSLSLPSPSAPSLPLLPFHRLWEKNFCFVFFIFLIFLFFPS